MPNEVYKVRMCASLCFSSNLDPLYVFPLFWLIIAFVTGVDTMSIAGQIESEDKC